ncbi:hypothetical protein, partial [Planotetraspora mira]|uniref:hypothetical protein n=1 Tax=Planotetraspora mira TaxID=58121 RepID=UPI003670CF8D
KIILCILLIFKSISVINYRFYITNGGYWVLPILAIFCIISTIYDAFVLKSKKNFFIQIKKNDERIQHYTYKAGYFSFLLTTISLILIFCSYVPLKISTFLNLIGLIIILNILIFLIIKYYYIYTDDSLKTLILSKFHSNKSNFYKAKLILGKVSLGLSIILTLLILNLFFNIVNLDKIEGLPLVLPLFVSPIGIILGLISFYNSKDKVSLIGIITNLLLLLFPFAYFFIITLTIGP